MATAILPALPASRRAVVQSAKKPESFELRTGLAMPAVSPEHVLIKVAAVAVNHCDYKMPARIHCPNTVDGCDFSGAVVRLGDSVARTPGGLRIGDRVAGAQMASQARRPWSGAFTEYIAEKPDNLWRVPEHFSWEQAASIGCAVASSVGMALWREMKLPGNARGADPGSQVCSCLWGLYGQRYLCYSTFENVSGLWFLLSCSGAQTRVSGPCWNEYMTIDLLRSPGRAIESSRPALPRTSSWWKSTVARRPLIITRRRAGKTYGHTPRTRWNTRWTSSLKREPSTSATRPSGVVAVDTLDLSSCRRI